MFGFLRKKKSLAELGDEMKPLIVARQEDKVRALLEELYQRREEDPEKAESLLAFGIIAASDMKLRLAEDFIPWFLDEYPESIMPIRMEIAQRLADSGQLDEAAETAREYLRRIRNTGRMNQIGSAPMVRLGSGKAFLLLGLAYAAVDARSYAKRVFARGLTLPHESVAMNRYRKEIARCDSEMRDQEVKALDAAWQAFFERGEDAAKLHEHCLNKGLYRLANRVDQLENHKRFNPMFQVDDDEMFLVFDEERKTARVGR